MPSLAEMLVGSVSQANDQAAQSIGQGLQSGIQSGMQSAQQDKWKGAELALQKQHLDMQTKQMQLEMQKLQDTKMQKGWDYMMQGQKLGPADRKNYMQWTEGYFNAMGAQMPKGALKSAHSDDMMGRAATLDTMVRSGQMKAEDAIDLMTNPLKADKLANIAITPAEMIGKTPDLNQAQEFALKQSQQRDENQANRDLKEELAKDRASGQGGAADARLATQIRAQFKPLSEKQASLSSAMDARDRIAAALQKDPTGSTASAQDMGAMIYSVLHGELGRVNQTELASQLHLPGIENMAQDQIVKALGGVNPAVAKGLIQRVNTAAQELDAQKDRLKKSFELEAQGRAVPTAAMGAFNTGPTYRPMQTEQVQFNGRSWSRADLQKLIDAHPNDLKTADARKALGG